MCFLFRLRVYIWLLSDGLTGWLANVNVNVRGEGKMNSNFNDVNLALTGYISAEAIISFGFGVVILLYPLFCLDL